MSCNNCTPTKPIPVCTLTLVLGNIFFPDMPVFIFVENLTTGYIHRQEATTSPGGIITLDLSKPDPSFYNPDNNYGVWVTLQVANVNEKEPIEIDSISYDCFQLSFSPFYDEDDNSVLYNSQTLEPIIITP